MTIRHIDKLIHYYQTSNYDEIKKNTTIKWAARKNKMYIVKDLLKDPDVNPLDNRDYFNIFRKNSPAQSEDEDDKDDTHKYGIVYNKPSSVQLAKKYNNLEILTLLLCDHRVNKYINQSLLLLSTKSQFINKCILSYVPNDIIFVIINNLLLFTKSEVDIL
jgi:hypothetical protein